MQITSINPLHNNLHMGKLRHWPEVTCVSEFRIISHQSRSRYDVYSLAGLPIPRLEQEPQIREALSGQHRAR